MGESIAANKTVCPRGIGLRDIARWLEFDVMVSCSAVGGTPCSRHARARKSGSLSGEEGI